MGIEDRTGRNLHEGQKVDVVSQPGVYEGQIINIEERTVEMLDQSKLPKTVTVVVVLTMLVDRHNVCPGLYVTAQPEKSDSLDPDLPQVVPSLN